MISQYYSIFDKNGFVQSYKTTGFTLKPGQVALAINVELDEDVFTTPPIPSVTIKADRSMLMQSINAELGGGE